ncbi:unnamed protein product, partial [Prorocentrum cordatum]
MRTSKESETDQRVRAWRLVRSESLSGLWVCYALGSVERVHVGSPAPGGDPAHTRHGQPPRREGEQIRAAKPGSAGASALEAPASGQGLRRGEGPQRHAPGRRGQRGAGPRRVALRERLAERPGAPDALVTSQRPELLAFFGLPVPRLLAFFGLPADGSRAPPLPAARQALAGGPFEVSEAFDLRRALVFRGEVAGGASSLDAVRESAQRLRSLAGCGVGQWECLLVRGVRGLLLVVVPREELEEYLNAPLPPVPALLLSYGVTSVYAQAAVPSVAGEPPLSPALLLVFGVFALAEAARYAAARYHGVRLLAPLPMPSAAYGSFGSATRV